MSAQAAPKSSAANQPGTGTSANISVTLPAWTFAANDYILFFFVIPATGVVINTVPTGFTAILAPTAFSGGMTYALYGKIATSGDAAGGTYTFVQASAARYAAVARVDADVGSVEAAIVQTGSGASTIPIPAIPAANLTAGDDREIAFYGTRPPAATLDTLTAPPQYIQRQSTSSAGATGNQAAAGVADRQLYGAIAATLNAGHIATSMLRVGIAVALKHATARTDGFTVLDATNVWKPKRMAAKWTGTEWVPTALGTPTKF